MPDNDRLAKQKARIAEMKDKAAQVKAAGMSEGTFQGGELVKPGAEPTQNQKAAQEISKNMGEGKAELDASQSAIKSERDKLYAELEKSKGGTTQRDDEVKPKDEPKEKETRDAQPVERQPGDKSYVTKQETREKPKEQSEPKREKESKIAPELSKNAPDSSKKAGDLSKNRATSATKPPESAKPDAKLQPADKGIKTPSGKYGVTTLPTPKASATKPIEGQKKGSTRPTGPATGSQAAPAKTGQKLDTKQAAPPERTQPSQQPVKPSERTQQFDTKRAAPPERTQPSQQSAQPVNAPGATRDAAGAGAAKPEASQEPVQVVRAALAEARKEQTSPQVTSPAARREDESADLKDLRAQLATVGMPESKPAVGAPSKAGDPQADKQKPAQAAGEMSRGAAPPVPVAPQAAPKQETKGPKTFSQFTREAAAKPVEPKRGEPTKAPERTAPATWQATSKMSEKEIESYEAARGIHKPSGGYGVTTLPAKGSKEQLAAAAPAKTPKAPETVVPSILEKGDGPGGQAGAQQGTDKVGKSILEKDKTTLTGTAELVMNGMPVGELRLNLRRS